MGYQVEDRSNQPWLFDDKEGSSKIHHVVESHRCKDQYKGYGTKINHLSPCPSSDSSYFLMIVLQQQYQ